MEQKLYMAVDLGTSFIKTGVYALDGTALAGWSEPVNAERPAPDQFVQRGENLYQSVLDCLKNTVKELGDRAKDVRAMAFTGQMAGSMGVDENWNDITSWSCSLDSRYLPYANRQREKLSREFFEIGGTNAPVMCSKYEWFKEDFPAEHKKIRKYVMLNGYIIGKLSGVPVDEAKIDYSLITWTGLSDIRKRQWSTEICGGIGMEPELLPQIVDCTTVGGYLGGDVAEQLGLPAGIPLIVGAGDKVSGCVGAGILEDGDTIFEAASYGAVSCKVRDVRLDTEKRNYDVIGAVDPDSYYAHKYIQGSGISTDWFVSTFTTEMGDDGKTAFRRAEELAKDVPAGSENMLAIGLLGGSAIPFDSDLRGLFMGHGWHHHKGHFYKALLESFSYDLALTLRSLERQYPEYAQNPIMIIGGGAKSSIWPQMLADVTGRIFQRLDREDVALWGAALLAAKAVGDVDDLSTKAKSAVHVRAVFTPNEENHKIYAPLVDFYERTCARMHSIFAELNAIGGSK